jgi:small subunit ribosomal protein S9
MAEDERPEEPTEGTPADAEGATPDDAAPAEEAAPEQPAAEEPAAEPTGEAEAAAPEPTATGAEGAEAPGGDAAPEQEAPRREPAAGETPSQPDVVPGAHLEPDLVLDQPSGEDDEFARYAEGDGDSESAASVEEETAPVPRSTIDLAADARYKATGKRKTAIARVIVKPGSGAYQINGRTLEQFFPRQTLQRTARQPLETVGYDTRMDVVARITGGGVSSQADALRHGISRALVEADPNLRTELKRRGFLTRDAREKERKKAGLKKARKRPQFSKR